MDRRWVWIAALSGLCAGCGNEVRGRAVSAADLARPGGTRQSKYMRSHQGLEEQAAAGYSQALLIDEASITRYDRREVCFDVTIRSDPEADQPPARWRVRVNGTPVTVESASEATARYPTGAGGPAVAVPAPDEPALEAAAPTPSVAGVPVWSVVGRRARFCGPSASNVPGRVKLELRLLHDLGQFWNVWYEWQIEPGDQAAGVS